MKTPRQKNYYQFGFVVERGLYNDFRACRLSRAENFADNCINQYPLKKFAISTKRSV